MTDSPGTRQERARAIREALGLRQDQFAARMNDVARQIGIEANYDAPKVSRIENDKRDIEANAASIIARLDPEKRGVDWLLHGDDPGGIGPLTGHAPQSPLPMPSLGKKGKRSVNDRRPPK